MLEIKNIHKTYEGKPLLQGVSFTVQAGETVCLLGASGSGKSTLLRIITGLEDADSGEVFWEGKTLQGVPVHLRRFGLMFQDYALFPHKNVAENVAFGLRMQRLPKAEIQERVSEALERVNLGAFARRRVTELSGGEQQRVALARALAPRPRLLMLDEPLGALDRALREELSTELRQLLHQTGIPAIYVTHDQEEAFTLADRIVLLHAGKVEQDGPPVEVYAHPNTAWAAGFLGLTNLLPGKVVCTSPLQVETRAGVFTPMDDPSSQWSDGQPVTLLVRPGAIRWDAGDTNLLHGQVSDWVFRGEFHRLEFHLDSGLTFQFQSTNLPPGGKLQTGTPLTIRLAAEGILCLPDGEQANHG